MPDRLLDPALAGGRDQDRDGGEGESGGERQVAVDRRGRQHEDRPVPQVERVRDPPEEAHRRQGEEAGGERPRTRRAAGDHEPRADRREERRRARERGRLLEDEPGQRNEAQPDRHEQSTDRARQTGQAGGPEGEECPESELPGPRRQGEERPRLGGRREHEGGGERQERDRDDGRAEPPDRGRVPPGPTSPPSAERGHSEQECRPEQVELLLDAERPEVEERRRSKVAREIVGCLGRKPQVRDIERGRGGIARDIRQSERRQEDRRQDHRAHDRDRSRRQEAPRPAGVELGEVDPAGRAQLAHDQARDQEAREHEEDIDPDIPAAEPREVGVIEQDKPDSDRPQALQFGPEVGARPARFIGRRAAHERLTTPWRWWPR